MNPGAMVQWTEDSECSGDKPLRTGQVACVVPAGAVLDQVAEDNGIPLTRLAVGAAEKSDVERCVVAVSSLPDGFLDRSVKSRENMAFVGSRFVVVLTEKLKPVEG